MSTTTVNIDAKMVKELRDKTGAPFGDCKNALAEAQTRHSIHAVANAYQALYDGD